jgi:hypothetical protein
MRNKQEVRSQLCHPRMSDCITCDSWGELCSPWQAECLPHLAWQPSERSGGAGRFACQELAVTGQESEVRMKTTASDPPAAKTSCAIFRAASLNHRYLVWGGSATRPPMHLAGMVLRATQGSENLQRPITNPQPDAIRPHMRSSQPGGAEPRLNSQSYSFVPRPTEARHAH